MHALWISLACNPAPPPGTTPAATPGAEPSPAEPTPQPADGAETPMTVVPPAAGDPDVSRDAHASRKPAPPRDLPSPPAALVPMAPDSPSKEKVGKTRLRKLEGFAAEDITSVLGRTVLLGDSITSGFPNARLLGSRVVNRGIGGDTIGVIRHRGVYERLESTVYNLRPVRIILMIGTNDLLWSAGTPLETKKLQYEHLVWKIRHDVPDVELVCVSVLPARGSHASKNADILAFNAAMAEAVPRYGARWIDVTATFVDASGQLREELARDSVHINSRGYERLSEIYLREIFADDEPPADAAKQAQR